MSNQLEITNLALDEVGCTPIYAVNEPTPEAELTGRIWNPLRRELLRLYPWNFAQRTVSLKAHETTLHQGQKGYPLSSDMLYILDVCASPYVVQQIEINGVFQKAILANGGDYLQLTYVHDEQNPQQWDPLFQRYFILKMAQNIAPKLIESTARTQLIANLATQAGRIAKQIDADEGTPTDIVIEGGWIDARGFSSNSARGFSSSSARGFSSSSDDWGFHNGGLKK